MANGSLEFLILASEKSINLTHDYEWVITTFSEVSMVYTHWSVKSPRISQDFKEGNGLKSTLSFPPDSLSFSLLLDALPTFLLCLFVRVTSHLIPPFHRAGGGRTASPVIRRRLYPPLMLTALFLPQLTLPYLRATSDPLRCSWETPVPQTVSFFFSLRLIAQAIPAPLCNSLHQSIILFYLMKPIF